MGYRSDVIQAFQFNNKDDLVAFVTMVKLTGNDTMKEVLNQYKFTRYTYLEDYTYAYVMYFEQDSVKWYDSNDDVIAHNALLKQALNHKAAMIFIRAGEDLGDTNLDQGGYDNCESYILDELFNIRQEVYISEDVDDTPLDQL